MQTLSKQGQRSKVNYFWTLKVRRQSDLMKGLVSDESPW